MAEDRQKLAESALYTQCIDVYNLMKKEGYEDAELDNKVVYEGHLTKQLDEELGLTVSQYSRVVGTLKDMGCISQLDRGTKGKPSRWVLIGEPNLDSYAYLRQKQGKVRERKKETIERQIRNLNAYAIRLEKRIEALEHGRVFYHGEDQFPPRPN